MLANRLGVFSSNLIAENLSSEVIHAAKRCILDWFSAVVPGGLEKPARLIKKSLIEEIGLGSSSLLPIGTMVTPRLAALINGTAADTLEVDDIHSEGIYHPGPPVIAASLAISQAKKISGVELIASVISGYEVSNRIAAAIQPDHYNYWHTTGTIGTIGAAAAVSVALELDTAQTKSALSNSVTMAAALQQAFATDSMGKPIHAGHAAEAGATAALLASKGVTGADGMFEGPRGFGNAMSEDVDWQVMVDSLNKEFTICRMTQKNHTCCGHMFAAIDSVLALCDTHGLAPDDVAAMTVGTYAKGVEICGNPDPKTLYEAKFSLEYTMAAALVTGQVRFAAFTDQMLDDPLMRKNMAKVACHIDKDAEQAFPNRRSAIVTITTTSGEIYEHYAPTRKGDPDDPLDDYELEKKFRELSEPVIGVDSAEALRQRVWALEEADDLSRLID